MSAPREPDQFIRISLAFMARRQRPDAQVLLMPNFARNFPGSPCPRHNPKKT
jgi:hypothetical protein